MTYAFKYARDKGITTYARYPYNGAQSLGCTYDSRMKNATLKGYSYIIVKDEVFLKNLLFSVGPLAVGVDASRFTFQNYKTGIYDDEYCSNIIVNHAVTLVMIR